MMNGSAASSRGFSTPSGNRHHGSSFKTTSIVRTSRPLVSPIQSPAGKLYSLPPALESPGIPHGSGSRARPGGLAASNMVDRGRQSPRTTTISIPQSPGSRSNSDQPTSPRSMSFNSTLCNANVRSENSLGVDNGPSAQDLYLFAQHCRIFYMSPDPSDESATYISSIFANAPPARRAVYTKLQSSIRSIAHLYHLRIRLSVFHALLSSTSVSGSLTPAARLNLSSSRAKGERKLRFGEFVDTWCTGVNAGGVEPFFRGLWGVLRGQGRGEGRHGGAGGHRVIWEVDDAVFLESGWVGSFLSRLFSESKTRLQSPRYYGMDRVIQGLADDGGVSGIEFMHESVNILKGVLGFEDQPLTSPPRLRPGKIASVSLKPADSADVTKVADPVGSANPARPSAQYGASLSPLIATQIASEISLEARSRSMSDPFLDPRNSPTKRRPDLHVSQAEHQNQAFYPRMRPTNHNNNDGDPSTNVFNNDEEQEVLLAHHRVDSTTEDDLDLTDDDIMAEERELNKPRFRLWTFPTHIADEEIDSLLSLFPRVFSRRKDVRFPISMTTKHEYVHGKWDEEYADDKWETIMYDLKAVRLPRTTTEKAAGVVRHGTGRMWVGPKIRQTGWQGSTWFRFKRWWERLFGVA